MNGIFEFAVIVFLTGFMLGVASVVLSTYDFKKLDRCKRGDSMAELSERCENE